MKHLLLLCCSHSSDDQGLQGTSPRSHSLPPKKQWHPRAEEQHWRGSRASWQHPDPMPAQSRLNKLPPQWSSVRGATHSSHREKRSFALLTHHLNGARACSEPGVSRPEGSRGRSGRPSSLSQPDPAPGPLLFPSTTVTRGSGRRGVTALAPPWGVGGSCTGRHMQLYFTFFFSMYFAAVLTTKPAQSTNTP